ncbi:MAG: hypothetical protein IT487_13000 [Chromatiaceae bacterium]|nr:hypothetical protein [Chromatiaceae bacterium]
MTTHITQRHIPRYLMVEAIDSLKRFDDLTGKRSNGVHLVDSLSQAIGICSINKGIYGIDIFQSPGGFPKEFCRLLEEDIPLLEAARKKVKADGDLYLLPKAKSYKKFPVAAPAKRLIEAIAFEREYRKKLDPHKFGIYSAFCTWRDFCYGAEITIDMIEGFVDRQFVFDADDFEDDEFLDLALAVQTKLLSMPIWGKGIQVSRDEAVPILAEGMAKLTSIQRAQFYLMNGMHAGGLFLPLAQVLGLNSWEDYEIRSRDFQLDSPEDQALRTETAFIRLLGDLGADIS